ncbi:MAG: hypothetical protein K0Q50_1216 [Vampirovibrio sp.]|nr:hypothetical protein [Vampirovibrio sp.]
MPNTGVCIARLQPAIGRGRHGGNGVNRAIHGNSLGEPNKNFAGSVGGGMLKLAYLAFQHGSGRQYLSVGKGHRMVQDGLQGILHPINTG